MKVIFYSEKCKFCNEIIKQLKNSKFYSEFKLLNIDTAKVPEKIKVVPTIIDVNYKDLLEGKKAFEYLYNKKYFNIPTNNIHLWQDKIIPNPEIEDDILAKKNDDELNEILNEPDVTKESDELKNDKPEKKENIPKKKKVLSRRNLLFIKGRN